MRPLTRRERDTARMLLSGQRYKQIARVLGISPGTAWQHVAHVCARVQVNSIPELVEWAKQHPEEIKEL